MAHRIDSTGDRQMWIGGRRRGGAKALSSHLRRTDENESVAVRDLEGFAFDGLIGTKLDKALRQMEVAGYGKGNKRILYHAMICPAYGETLTPAQRDMMIDYYTKHMGFKGHQRVVVEHWKNGKQHFHLVFNIIHPVTGKIHELKWTKRKEWTISRSLEEMLGFSTPATRGKAARTWESQRGKRTGINPTKMRKEVTAIFHASKMAKEFAAALDKAGYTLTRGRDNQLVLVDRFGDTHGLMRRIEGKKLADLRRKFPGLEQMQFEPHANLVKARKPKKAIFKCRRKPIDRLRVREDVQKAYRTSSTGAAFFTNLNKQRYTLGRGRKGFAVIDRNGDRHDISRFLGKATAKRLTKKFPDLAVIRPRPVSDIIRRLKAKKRGGSGTYVSRGRTFIAQPLVRLPAVQGIFRPTSLRSSLFRMYAKAARQSMRGTKNTAIPFRPTPVTKGWPEAALIDWAAWGHKDQSRFFKKWPELATGGFRSDSGPDY